MNQVSITTAEPSVSDKLPSEQPATSKHASDKHCTGADIVIKCLEAEGVKFVFGYPGGAVLHIYDAIYKQNHFKHILVRHEQAAVHAADAFSRATGEVGVAPVSYTHLDVYKRQKNIRAIDLSLRIK